MTIAGKKDEKTDKTPLSLVLSRLCDTVLLFPLNIPRFFDNKRVNCLTDSCFSYGKMRAVISG